MVNETTTEPQGDRREKPRVKAEHASALGFSKLNPFGDLHTMQHLSARFARGLRPVFEPMLRRAVRCWTEPLEVVRFHEYRTARSSDLTAWVPVAMTPADGSAMVVMEGRFALELLDLFFGGFGETPDKLPNEFSPAAEAIIRRIVQSMLEPLASAWEPVARVGFETGVVESNPAMFSALDGEDPVIVTRFGIAGEGDQPSMIDILYPVAALKPLAQQINARVHGRSSEPDPRWRNGLTRATMGVRFPVRSVLAEPQMSLGKLLELKEGDVIPISFGPAVPIMVGNCRFGTGTVGTANGMAAIRIQTIDPVPEEEDQ